MSLTPRTGRFTSQRLSLAYVDWGPQDAPPLLLVHGGWDQKRSWDAVARHLAGRYRVFAHDLRGHGESDHVNDGDYGVMDHVYDLAQFVRHLGLSQFTLVGHSLGGNIAVRYTGLYPERVDRLTLVEGLGPSPKLIAERKAKSVEDRLLSWIGQREIMSAKSARIMAGLDEATARMTTAHPHLAPELIRHLTETGTRRNPDGTLSWCYDPASLGRSPSDISPEDFQHLCGRVACPVWLVYGGQSQASNPERDGRADWFSDWRLTEYAASGHWPQHDNTERFLSDLDAFLTS